MNYVPQIDDYVVWNERGFEGWVYFKSESYVTIEVLVRKKDEINYAHCSLHQNERLLILCYENQWNELNYVKSRKVMNDYAV